MTNGVWQLQDAKSRFSELVETVIQKGAQTVTKHGKPAVVVISAEEYRRSLAPRKSLAAALRACPEDLAPLLGKRPKQIARQVNIG
jgi:antitoxin Phd